MTIDEAIKHCKDVAIEKREEAEETYRAFCLYSLNAEAESTFVDECEKCEKCAEQHEQLAEWLEELKEYKELEEQEMLIKLPCKIGDTVYIIGCKYRHGIQEKWINTRKFEYSDLEKLNKTVFLTKEEAEKALKRLEDNKPIRCIDPCIKLCQDCKHGWVKYPEWVECYEDTFGCVVESGCIYNLEDTVPTKEEEQEFERRWNR